MIGVLNLVRRFRNALHPRIIGARDGGMTLHDAGSVNNAAENIVAFVRRSPKTEREIVCVCNFSAVPRKDYRLILPQKVKYNVVINTDAKVYGGEGSDSELNGDLIDLPPLSTLWLAPPKQLNRTRTPQKRIK